VSGEGALRPPLDDPDVVLDLCLIVGELVCGYCWERV
jgi:hypothetical protein